MAFNAQQISVNWIFGISGTDEVAYTGMSYSFGAGWTGAAAAVNALTDTDLEALYVAMTALMDTAQLQWADYSNLVGVKVAALDTEGHYLPTASIKQWEAAVVEHGASQQILPQSTVVVSLRTVTTLGKGNYGRMYLPHTKVGQGAGDASGNLGTVGPIATNAGAFVEDVTAALRTGTDVDVVPVIMGQTGVGTQKLVTHVMVGTVTDTQRRRRNRLVEVYADQVVTLP